MAYLWPWLKKKLVYVIKSFLKFARFWKQRWKSGRARFGPGFEPNFPKRNRAQSSSIEGALANNFFSFGHISQSYPNLLENCWQRSALALSQNATVVMYMACSVHILVPSAKIGEGDRYRCTS